MCTWYSLKRELALINKELQNLRGAECESQRRDPPANWTKVCGVAFLCTLLQFCFVQVFFFFFLVCDQYFFSAPRGNKRPFWDPLNL